MIERMVRSVLRVLLGGVLAAGLLLILGRCDLTTPVERHALVVQAFLKTDRALPTITLRQTRPLNAPGDRRAHAATGAEIDVVLGGQTISYEGANSEPGQYVPVAEDQVVSAGESWRLSVRWRGGQAQARGQAPPSIELTEMCVEVPQAPIQAILVDSLRRDSLDIPAEQGYLYPIDVSLRWPATLSSRADTTHWVRPLLSPDTTESASRIVSVFLEPVEVRREDQFRIRDGQRRWEGVYAVPVQDSTSAFPRHDLTATLTRGDTAFAAFARSRNDPERREPISNVEGGLGVAMAVAVDSLRRPVAPGRKRCYSR